MLALPNRFWSIILFIVANLALFGLTFGKQAADLRQYFREEAQGISHEPEHPSSFKVEFSGGSKDYPLWYAYGLRAAHAELDLYPEDPDVDFPFLYPPLAAILLILPSRFGPYGCVAVLGLVNVLSFTLCRFFAERIVCGDKPPSPAVRTLPWLLWILFVYDMFFVGQPNMLLLAFLLAGFDALRLAERGPRSTGFRTLAGACFAMAAAIKAFPITIVAYLVWRRFWGTLLSMLLFLVVFSILVPAPIRGLTKTVHELGQWASRMIPRHDGEKVAQRGEQAKGWKNQSLLAVGHRLLRPIDIDCDAPSVLGADGQRTPPPPVYVNLVSLSPNGAALVIALAAGLIGLSFAAILPRQHQRTADSDAAERGALIALMIIASPIAYPYYFVWMIFPATVVIHHMATTPDSRFRNRLLVGFLILLVIIGAHAATMEVPHLVQGVGNHFWSALVMAILCGMCVQRTQAKEA